MHVHTCIPNQVQCFLLCLEHSSKVPALARPGTCEKPQRKAAPTHPRQGQVQPSHSNQPSFGVSADTAAAAGQALNSNSLLSGEEGEIPVAFP